MPNYVDIDAGLKDALNDIMASLNEDDWMMPAITGDLEDPNSYTKPFSTDNLNVNTAKAVSQPDEPGSTTDMIIGPLQVDLLDSMRGAMLLRHCYPWSRCVMLARGRDQAQADPQGPLSQYLSYLQAVLKQGRGEDQQ